MKILRLGHACFLYETKSGKKYLVDPFFSMNPGCPESFLNDKFYQSIDAVFLTHAHFDHISGLEEVQKANPNVLVIAQYELALLLMNKGYQAYPINFGGSIQLEDVKATMVQAKHTSSYGETEGTAVYAGEPAGYVFKFTNDETVYHSGDTCMMMDMKLIQDFHQPSIAVLSCSGQFVMGPEEANYVVRNLLNVKYVIPSHTFPSMDEAPRPEVLKGLLQNFPVIENMMGQDKQLEQLLSDYEQTTVVALSYGESKEF